MGLTKFFYEKLEEYKAEREKQKEIRMAEREAYNEERLNKAEEFAKVKVQKELNQKKAEAKNVGTNTTTRTKSSKGGWKAPSADEFEDFVMGAKQ